MPSRRCHLTIPETAKECFVILPRMPALSPVWKERTQDVDSQLLEAVESGLNHFGPTFKNVVFHELKNAYNLDSHSIGRKPLIFSEFLDRVFSVGSVTIKKAIILEIGRKFSLSTDGESDLTRLIQKVRDGQQR